VFYDITQAKLMPENKSIPLQTNNTHWTTELQQLANLIHIKEMFSKAG